jgi:hypothetical protein
MKSRRGSRLATRLASLVYGVRFTKQRFALLGFAEGLATQIALRFPPHVFQSRQDIALTSTMSDVSIAVATPLTTNITHQLF